MAILILWRLEVDTTTKVIIAPGMLVLMLIASAVP
jgi:hypothetical protein